MNTKIKILASLASLLLVLESCQKDPFTLYQYGQISGVVIDGQTQKPLSGVTIATNPGSATTVTNAKGEYTLTDVKVGTVTLTADKYSYTQYSSQVTVIENKTTAASFAMLPSSSTVGTVTLTSSIPDSNALNIKSIVTLSWKSKREAPIDTITYTVSITKAGTNIQKIYSGIKDTLLQVKGLEFNTKYYWRVSAVYAKKEIASSYTWPFTTMQIPNAAIFFSRSSSNGLSEIVAADPDLTYEDEITTNYLPTAFAPVSYKNSGTILFTSYENNIPYVFTMRRDGTGQMRVSPRPNMSNYSVGNGYTFYDHGNKFLYTNMDGLYAVNLDGTNETKIASAPANRHFTNVDWCPETGKIVVRTVGPMPYQSEFYIMNNDGSDMQLLVGGVTGMLESPSFSPNGRYLVYTQDISGYISINGDKLQSHIFVKDLQNPSSADTDISAANNNQTNGQNDLYPRFGPDSRQIIFVNKSNISKADGNIYTIDIFNLERTQIITGGTYPFWAN